MRGEDSMMCGGYLHACPVLCIHDVCKMHGLLLPAKALEDVLLLWRRRRPPLGCCMQPLNVTMRLSMVKMDLQYSMLTNPATL